MKKFTKIASIFLTVILLTSTFSIQVSAVANPVVLTAEASYKNETITINGTVEDGILAVAIMLYSGEELLRMETGSVTESNTYSESISEKLSPGLYTIKVADFGGGEYLSTSFSVKNNKISTQYISKTPAASTSATPAASITPTPTADNSPGETTYNADVSSGSNLKIKLDDKLNNALVVYNPSEMESDEEEKQVRISFPIIPDANSYSVDIPAPVLSKIPTDTESKNITIETNLGSITVPDDMLTNTGVKENIVLTISSGDKDTLPPEVKEAIGNRTMIRLTLTVDDEVFNWKNENAPATVSIPYTPTSEELDNQENIVIWYIDDEGKIIPVPNGSYDASSGKVTFTTTHFSHYAVGFNKVSFKDVLADAWYKKAVSFLASRNITNGTGNADFSPNKNLTRADFIVLMMRAYQIEPDQNPTDNFADAGNIYYTGYLAAAKRLGISNGVGNNQFEPNTQISREEMFTLFYKALKMSGQIPNTNTGKALDAFADSNQISPWAHEAMSIFVQSDMVKGSNGNIYPKTTTTRAEMAQILYNLLGK